MKYLRCPIKAKKGERVVLHFDQATRVMILDSRQLTRYREGQSYQYRGGFREESPQQFEIYRDGEYHAVVELGGHYEKMEIEANVEVLPPAPPEYSEDFSEQNSNAESVVYDADEAVDEQDRFQEEEDPEEVLDSIEEETNRQDS